MNSNSPVATGAAAVSGAMLGGVIVWLCSVLRITPPPEEVAGTLGAIVLVGGHMLVNWINVRWPAPVLLTEADIAKPAPAPAKPLFTQPVPIFTQPTQPIGPQQ